MPGAGRTSQRSPELDPALLLSRLIARGHTLVELEGLLQLSPGYLSKLRRKRARPSVQLLALLALLESSPASTTAALRSVAGAARAPARERRTAWQLPAPAGGGAALPALLAVAPELDRRGVRWALGGAVAMEAFGLPRDTIDVDIFVDDAFRSALNVFRAAGLGIAHYSDDLVAAYPSSGGENDRIDVIFPRLEPAASAVRRAVRRPLRGVSLPVLPVLTLAAMKLMAARAKEHADALRLLDAGLTSRRALRAELARLAEVRAPGDRWSARHFDPVAALRRLEAAR